MTPAPRRAPGFACALFGAILWLGITPQAAPAPPPLFTAASFNLANWGPSDRWINGRHVGNADKPESERRAVAAILRHISPDILAVQEVIRDPRDRHLEDFKETLRSAGMDYPEAFSIAGFDERIQIALFSRFPMRERHALNEDQYELTQRSPGGGGNARRERRRVERGFIHAIVEVRPDYRVEIFAAHLKSRKAAPECDSPGETGEAAIRRHEAEILRRHVEARAAANPEANILILGDLNDTLGSRPLQILAGRRSDPVRFYPLWLHDYLRDAWTHVFIPEREYAMIDYAIASQGLFNEYSPAKSRVYRERPEDPAELRWDSASDHRPIVAAFYAADLSYTEKEKLEARAPTGP